METHWCQQEKKQFKIIITTYYFVSKNYITRNYDLAAMYSHYEQAKCNKQANITPYFDVCYTANHSITMAKDYF